MQPFERFEELFYHGKVTKKYETELELEALKWWKDNFKAVFGSHSNCTQKELPFLWHFSMGMLILSVKEIDGYYYKFIVKCVMFNYLKVPAYLEGFNHVRKLRKLKERCSRDANPYAKYDFYNRQAWDCGYICGLSNKHITAPCEDQPPFKTV